MNALLKVMRAISLVFLHYLLIYECMRVINIMIRISITSIDFNHNLAGFQKKMEFVNDIEPWLDYLRKILSIYRRLMNPIPSPPPVKVSIMLLLFLARLLPLITGFDRNHALEARAHPDTPVLSAFNNPCKRVI